jgi:hypothetical protein
MSGNPFGHFSFLKNVKLMAGDHLQWHKVRCHFLSCYSKYIRIRHISTRQHMWELSLLFCVAEIWPICLQLNIPMGSRREYSIENYNYLNEGEKAICNQTWLENAVQSYKKAAFRQKDHRRLRRHLPSSDIYCHAPPRPALFDRRRATSHSDGLF